MYRVGPTEVTLSHHIAERTRAGDVSSFDRAERARRTASDRRQSARTVARIE